jgi:thiamine-monophosphate kinase
VTDDPQTPSEFRLIGRIREAIADTIDERGSRVIRASGDDAAVVRADGVVVTSVDAFVEGVHFRLATTSLGDLGHKCLAASLSDLAAMGASAGEAYLVLGLPPSIGEREVLELVGGARALAAEVGVAICGGDITRSEELFVTVTVVGHAAAEDQLAGRDGARPGDLLAVTGQLGGAAAGFLLLERKGHGLPVEIGEGLLDRHRRPYPLLGAGRALAGSVSAMIDVSDGLASDCERIAEASGVAIEVELERLPVDEGVDQAAAIAELSGTDLAAIGGEDYELLVSVRPEARAAAEAAAASADTSLTWIGGVREGTGVRLLDEAGRARSLAGWNHRASSPGWSASRRGRVAR